MIETLNEYLEYKQSQVAESTLYRLKIQLEHFLRAVKKKGVYSFGDLSKDAFIRWSSQRRKELSRLVHYQEVSIVQSFLEWLVREGYLLSNPYENRNQRPNYPIRKLPTRERIKAEIQETERSSFPLRNKAILELMYSSGLRRAELLGLKLEDIENSLVRVLGKGDKERLVPITKQAQKALKAYLSYEREQIIKQTESSRRQKYTSADLEYVFLSRYGKRLKHLQDALKKVKVKPHHFRHACASHMLQNGCNIRVLQKMLGHESLGTTAIYVDVNKDDLRNLMGSFHPRG